MIFQDIDSKYQSEFNVNVNHPLQTFEWGEFRKKTGIKIIRRGVVEKNKVTNPYQISIHQTPGFPYFIGYFPKGDLPTNGVISDLGKMGAENNISFFQLEPNIINGQWPMVDSRMKKSFHPLFTKYTFILDLTKPEEELLKDMHQKTRYNIRLSEKKGVKVEIDNSKKAFEEYLKLTEETTKRQKFYAHDSAYHILLWETLGNSKNKPLDPNKLQANLLKASFKSKTLVTYILFTFKDKLYYPYGASSDEYREVMASPATMWGAIKYGKGLGLKTFDMWGAANVPDPKPDNEYFGFHRFKQGFGAKLVEFVGSYDLVINPLNYRLLTVADKIRWTYLRAKKSK